MFYFREEYLNWKSNNNFGTEATNLAAVAAENKNNYILINASIIKN